MPHKNRTYTSSCTRNVMHTTILRPMTAPNQCARFYAAVLITLSICKQAGRQPRNRSFYYQHKGSVSHRAVHLMRSVSQRCLHGNVSYMRCVSSLLSVLCMICTPIVVSATPTPTNSIGPAIAGNAGTNNTVLILESTTGHPAASPIPSCNVCSDVTGNATYGDTWEACARPCISPIIYFLIW